MNVEDLALRHMALWRWRFTDPDGGNWPNTFSLFDAVNLLARDGFSKSPDLILSLLASGKLIASGSTKWCKFEGEHFYAEGYAHVSANKWKALALGLTENRKYNLTELNILDAEGGEWSWQNSRFATAYAHGEIYDGDYFEEYFSAWDIVIHPPEKDELESEAVPAPSIPVANKGGRPPEYNWELAIAELVFKWADEGNWQPSKQSDVTNELAEWFAQQGATPSLSLIKQRAKWLFPLFESRNPDGQ